LDLLGGFRLVRGTQMLHLPPGGERLLAFLALHGRLVPRPYVFGTLWPDTPEGCASANLRSAVWRVLRRDRRLVVSRGPHLGLGPDITVDVAAPDTWGEATDWAEEGAWPAIRRLLDVGELLPDWPDEWVCRERELLRHRRLVALDRACGGLVAAGRRPLAVQTAFAILRDEPLRESAHRVLVAAQLANGNSADAVWRYRFYRDLLARQVGLRPSPEMAALGRRAGPAAHGLPAGEERDGDGRW
jgi:DNA-binding SARP family transcriptional activator